MTEPRDVATSCRTELRGRSVRITPPSGRSYWAPMGETEVFPCLTCQGEGHHDSCFDCGNRGYNDRPGWREQITSGRSDD